MAENQGIEGLQFVTEGFVDEKYYSEKAEAWYITFGFADGGKIKFTSKHNWDSVKKGPRNMLRLEGSFVGSLFRGKNGDSLNLVLTEVKSMQPLKAA